MPTRSNFGEEGMFYYKVKKKLGNNNFKNQKSYELV